MRKLVTDPSYGIELGKRAKAFIGRVSAIVEHFFDVDVTKSQPWSNNFHDRVQNLKPSFVEENHGIFGPNR